MWFREGRADWAREALSLTPEYLRHHANDLDYKASQLCIGWCSGCECKHAAVQWCAAR